ncbi:MAG TPA: VanZ family protein [Candidatus Limnocylindrales bacterium]|nr:VanZ family protein [Candidatus Limnocylindrales bacterium]
MIGGYVLVVPAFAAAMWWLSTPRNTLVTAAGMLAIAHVMFVLAITFFPFPIRSSTIAFHQIFDSRLDNLVPFDTIGRQLLAGPGTRGFRDLMGNAALLMPMAFYLPVLWPRFRSARQVILAGLGASLAIELGQFAVSFFWLHYSYRTTDIDDVIANTFGVIVGALIVQGGRMLLAGISQGPASTTGQGPASTPGSAASSAPR